MARFARDLMVREVGVVESHADLATLERCFAEAGVSGLPVVEAGVVVGVVSRADVLGALGAGRPGVPRPSRFYADLDAREAEEIFESFAAVADGGKRLQGLRVGDLMSREIIAVEPDTPLEDVARTLVAHRVHRALVIDGGALAGIITALDIVRLVGEGRLVSR